MMFEQAQAMFVAGRTAEAVALVERAAEAGEPDAQVELGHWRLFGVHGPRDEKAAHRHFREAASRGHVEAIRIRAFFVAAGFGCDAKPDKALRMLEKISALDPYAARQLDLLGRMRDPAAARRAPREILSDDPRIELVHSLLTPEECTYVARLAEPQLEASFVIDPVSHRRVPSPLRTSFGTNMGPTQEDLVLNAINRRLAAASGTRYECGEPMHVLRYAPGQEYRPHFDALPGVDNQRVVTALIYLNEGYEGGETVFPGVGVSARGAQGDVLIFRNALPDGRADPRTKHAGRPVTAGVKWLASRWIRQRPHDPWSA